MSFFLSKSNESDDKAITSPEQKSETEGNTSNFTDLASKLWETGKRRFSVTDNGKTKINATNPVESTNRDLDKELDPVDEESYKQAAQLLKESTNQNSVNYDSIQASNANAYTADKTDRKSTRLNSVTIRSRMPSSA